MDKVEEFIH